MLYNKEDIGKIIRGERKLGIYCEDISNRFAQFEMAMFTEGGICIVSLELSGDVIMTIRLMRSFGREPKYIIIPEVDSDNEFNNLIREMGCFDKICTYKDYMDRFYSDDDIYIGCYMSKINKKDMRTMKFKIRKNLSNRFKGIKLKNPISDKLTSRSLPFISWGWSRNCYSFMVYYGNHIKELEDMYDKLEDDESRDTFVEIIRTYCENDKHRLPEHAPFDKYWECYRHLDDEKWVNCGSCYGDTIGFYAHNRFKYEYIDAYEGDAETFGTLKENLKKLKLENINLYNDYIGLEGDLKTNFDARYADRGVTLINMDIEGAETGVLKGAKKIMAQQQPVLAVCAYHKPSDIIEIPKIVLEANENYAVYLRKYAIVGRSIEEYVYYFVPQNRKLDFT